MLTHDGCRARQQRLLRQMEANKWDLFLTGNCRTAYYLTGALGPADLPCAFALGSDGRSVLVSGARQTPCCDEFLKLETYSIQRSLNNLAADAAALFGSKGLNRKVVCAVEHGATPVAFTATLPDAAFADATAVLFALRKQKEEDEVGEIRESLRLCAEAYRAARTAISPGRTELDVYLAMYDAVARASGTSVVFRGDFACGERGIDGGGPPTTRVIEPGDLFILDLFPEPALYFGDTCRTFAAGTPTDLQYKAWETVCEAKRMAESLVRPGLPARGLYQQIKEFLDAPEWSGKSFWHHLGHGIGYHGHELPRIIPGSDDVFEVGDVFALEPGIYGKALGGGIRIEDNYVVRENGIEDLFVFPQEL